MKNTKIATLLTASATALGVLPVAALSVLPAATAQAAEVSVTANAASTKMIGDQGYVWGKVSNVGPRTVVNLQVKAGKEWITQKSNVITDRVGFYTIPVKTSVNIPGTQTFRIYAEGDGSGTATSKEFTITRTMRVTVASAGTKRVNERTFIWGRTAPGLEVHTQVKVNGKWSTSNMAVSDEDGSYAVKVTYNPGVAGQYQYRTYANYGNKTYFSNEVTLKRTK